MNTDSKETRLTLLVHEKCKVVVTPWPNAVWVEVSSLGVDQVWRSESQTLLFTEDAATLGEYLQRVADRQRREREESKARRAAQPVRPPRPKATPEQRERDDAFDELIERHLDRMRERRWK